MKWITSSMLHSLGGPFGNCCCMGFCDVCSNGVDDVDVATVAAFGSCSIVEGVVAVDADDDDEMSAGVIGSLFEG